MRFQRDGDWHQAIRVTGPAHNLLGLKFGERDGALPVVERLSPNGEATGINAEDVREQVLQGIGEADADLSAQQVIAIRFVGTDTPSSRVYRMMAKAIVQRVAREGLLSAA